MQHKPPVPLAQPLDEPYTNNESYLESSSLRHIQQAHRRLAAHMTGRLMDQGFVLSKSCALLFFFTESGENT